MLNEYCREARDFRARNWPPMPGPLIPFAPNPAQLFHGIGDLDRLPQFGANTGPLMNMRQGPFGLGNLFAGPPMPTARSRHRAPFSHL